MSKEDRVWFVKRRGRILHAARSVSSGGVCSYYRAYCGTKDNSLRAHVLEPSGNGSHLFVCRRCHEGAMKEDGGIR